MSEIKIPKSSVNDEQVLIAEWKFSNFDFVKKGKHLLSIETSKVIEEIYSETDGYLEILCKTNDRVAPGQVVGFLKKNREKITNDQLTNVKTNIELNLTSKANNFIKKNKINFNKVQLSQLKKKNIVKEKDIIEILQLNKNNNINFQKQLIILIKEKKPYHAAVYFNNFGIYDLSLLGSKNTPETEYNFNNCKCLFYNLGNNFNIQKAINFFEKPCLLTDKIIKKEKSNRGWFKKTESADYILNFRQIRSTDMNDMNCIEWLIFGIQKGGIEIPKNILTAQKLNEWAIDNLSKIEKKENIDIFSKYYNEK